jgi:hypothetical protein
VPVRGSFKSPPLANSAEFILADNVLGSKSNDNRSNASDRAPRRRHMAVELDDILLAVAAAGRDLAQPRRSPVPVAALAVYKRLFRCSR